MATVFDRILDGELPSHEVYADEHVYAFLDINPISLGHTLVIPRERGGFSWTRRPRDRPRCCHAAS